VISIAQSGPVKVCTNTLDSSRGSRLGHWPMYIAIFLTLLWVASQVLAGIPPGLKPPISKLSLLSRFGCGILACYGATGVVLDTHRTLWDPLVRTIRFP